MVVIVTAESPLRRIPAALNRKQALFIDGIRIAAEMIDSAYVRLEDFLLHSGEMRAGELRIAAPFLDAWSIVDSAHRFLGLIEQAPLFKGKWQSPSFRATQQHSKVV